MGTMGLGALPGAHHMTIYMQSNGTDRPALGVGRTDSTIN